MTDTDNLAIELGPGFELLPAEPSAALAEPLSPDEAADLARLEAVVDKALLTLDEAGEAIRQIRDRRLYRATHVTFEDYCRERWSFGRHYANRLAAAADVRGHLAAVAEAEALPAVPETEAQARGLVGLEPEQRIAAWKRACERAAEEGRTAPTQRLVAAAVDELYRGRSREVVPEDGEPWPVQGAISDNSIELLAGHGVRHRYSGAHGLIVAGSPGRQPAVTVEWVVPGRTEEDGPGPREAVPYNRAMAELDLLVQPYHWPAWCAPTPGIPDWGNVSWKMLESPDGERFQLGRLRWSEGLITLFMKGDAQRLLPFAEARRGWRVVTHEQVHEEAAELGPRLVEALLAAGDAGLSPEELYDAVGRRPTQAGDVVREACQRQGLWVHRSPANELRYYHPDHVPGRGGAGEGAAPRQAPPPAETPVPGPLFRLLDAEFGFTLDVAASAEQHCCERYLTAKDDGLKADWGTETCWLFPPSCEDKVVATWLRKAADAARAGATVVALLAFDPTDAWLHEWARLGEIRLLPAPVRLPRNYYVAPDPACLVIYRPGLPVESRILRWQEGWRDWVLDGEGDDDEEQDGFDDDGSGYARRGAADEEPDEEPDDGPEGDLAPAPPADPAPARAADPWPAEPDPALAGRCAVDQTGRTCRLVEVYPGGGLVLVAFDGARGGGENWRTWGWCREHLTLQAAEGARP